MRFVGKRETRQPGNPKKSDRRSDFARKLLTPGPPFRESHDLIFAECVLLFSAEGEACVKSLPAFYPSKKCFHAALLFCFEVNSWLCLKAVRLIQKGV
ncbi:hypothetical protein IRJ41_011449 [Triplophysa rosa]|uniref:Uncharacterized protein n=1 Tax=Triplophysa rosa TaxID=992332 RepID=A0A9W7TDB1_TRIRA|nr:hypothetical protein IRJ41_011449 [Triplophysa rosa]